MEKRRGGFHMFASPGHSSLLTKLEALVDAGAHGTVLRDPQADYRHRNNRFIWAGLLLPHPRRSWFPPASSVRRRPIRRPHRGVHAQQSRVSMSFAKQLMDIRPSSGLCLRSFARGHRILTPWCLAQCGSSPSSLSEAR